MRMKFFVADQSNGGIGDINNAENKTATNMPPPLSQEPSLSGDKDNGAVPPPPTDVIKKTIGQYRVGVEFNPGKFPSVDQIKFKAAEVIDAVLNEGDAASESIGADGLKKEFEQFDTLVNTLSDINNFSHPEVKRLFKESLDHIAKADAMASYIGASFPDNAEAAAALIETAAMWAVKAVTKSLPE